MRTLAILLLTTRAFAQDSFLYSGRVDDPNGRHLNGAIVRLHAANQLTREARTNAEGKFEITLPLRATVLLTAETEGLSLEEPLPLDEAKQNLSLILHPRALRNSITVTAATQAISIDDSGKAVDSLDAESLARRNELFFLESMRLTPGLQVQQIGGPGAPSRIVTRGLRSADTALLIDGFRFRDITSTQGDSSALQPDLLVVNPDRFEACRGSESSLYGTHAIGGVINIATNQGGGPLNGELSFEGGGLGLLRGLAKASGGENKWQWTAALSHLNVLNGVDGNDTYRNTGSQSFVRYIVTPKTSLSARLFTTEAFSQYNSGPGARSGVTLPPGTIPGTFAYFTPQLEDPDARRATRTLMALAGLDHQFTPQSNLRLQYNRLHSNRYDANGPGGQGFQAAIRDFNRFQGDLDTIAARYSFKSFLAGYEFEREHFYNFGDSGTAASRRQVGITQLSNAVYAAQRLTLFQRLLVNVSGRIQDFHLRQPNFYSSPALYGTGELKSPPRAYTGDISLAYLIAKSNTKLRSHFGNAYRAPSLYERFGTALFSGRYSVYGDPNLKPDRGLSIDAGIDQYFWNSRLRASATYFYTRLQEVVAFGPVPREPYGRTSGYFNTGGGLSRGVETSFAAQPTRKLSFNSTYTFVNAIERNPIFITGELQPQRVFPHTFATTATYFWTRNFDTTVDFFAASSYLVPFFASSGGSFGTRAFRFAGPRKLDLAARYRVPLGDRRSLEFFTRLENLSNRTYYEAGYQTPGFWGTAGLRFRL
jgi:iron complex outermembrane receptor protein